MQDTVTNREFLEFEQEIKDLFEQANQIKETATKTRTDLSASLRAIEKKILDKRRNLTKNLSSWQRVQLSRHPNRPYTAAYIKRICSEFIELHGDRNFRDDRAIVGGLGRIEQYSIMLIGHQKGTNTKTRQMRNFGMPNPEGYRKALRLMKLAEKFNLPIICFVDTPGAFPGIEAEARGQGEAIARNIYEMLRLKVPVIVIIIGEGASGGALGIGIGDKTFMLENTWYTVISPESCSSILWHSWEHKITAANQLQLTANHMLKFGLIDDIIKECPGGAHWNYTEMANIIKERILIELPKLITIPPKERISQRIAKFSNMGIFDEK